jgi:hypothetical protein
MGQPLPLLPTKKRGRHLPTATLGLLRWCSGYPSVGQSNLCLSRRTALCIPRRLFECHRPTDQPTRRVSGHAAVLNSFWGPSGSADQSDNRPQRGLLIPVFFDDRPEGAAKFLAFIRCATRIRHFDNLGDGAKFFLHRRRGAGELHFQV